MGYHKLSPPSPYFFYPNCNHLYIREHLTFVEAPGIWKISCCGDILKAIKINLISSNYQKKAQTFFTTTGPFIFKKKKKSVQKFYQKIFLKYVSKVSKKSVKKIMKEIFQISIQKVCQKN